MTREVEIHSVVDEVYKPNRRVWYSVTLDGKPVGEPGDDWAPINARAWALVEKHNAVLIDRSDKESGFLLSTLGQ